MTVDELSHLCDRGEHAEVLSRADDEYGSPAANLEASLVAVRSLARLGQTKAARDRASQVVAVAATLDATHPVALSALDAVARLSGQLDELDDAVAASAELVERLRGTDDEPRRVAAWAAHIGYRHRTGAPGLDGELDAMLDAWNRLDPDVRAPGHLDARLLAATIRHDRAAAHECVVQCAHLLGADHPLTRKAVVAAASLENGQFR